MDAQQKAGESGRPGGGTQKIVWNERFSVGVPAMDAQHKNLIELINALGPSAGTGAASAGVAGMFAYAAAHFQNEEALLLQSGYSELAAQQSEHASFLLKAAEFSKQNLSDLELCSQIKAFLLSWILHHILESDMKYKRCIPERLGR